MSAHAFSPRRRRNDRQRTLDEGRKPTGRGGWRPGAGRKANPDRRDPAHRTRLPVDPYSSGPSFDGWRNLDRPLGLPARYQPLPTSPPTVWLLTTGWRRYRLIGVDERPEARP